MQHCLRGLLKYMLAGAMMSLSGWVWGAEDVSLVRHMPFAYTDTTLVAVDTTLMAVDTTDTLREDTLRVSEEQRNPNRDIQQQPASTVPSIFKDSTRLAIEERTRQAWRRSMFIPGWGQITNGGLWWIKVPVIYGGFVSTGLIFEFNHRHYRIVLEDVQYRILNNHALPPDSPYDYIGADPQGTEYLISWKDYHRRMRDIAVLATIGWYALNIIEAYVDSILKYRWEIGDELTFQAMPAVIPSSPSLLAHRTPVLGFNIKLNLK